MALHRGLGVQQYGTVLVHRHPVTSEGEAAELELRPPVPLRRCLGQHGHRLVHLILQPHRQ